MATLSAKPTMKSEDKAESQRPIVGFVGLGDMGRGIVKRIAAAGYRTICYDIRPEAITSILQSSTDIQAASSLAELGQRADIVGVAVLDDAQVLDVALRSGDGLLAHLKKGSTILVNSTVRPRTMQELSLAAKEKGIDVLDAAMSGGAERAAKGQLTIMVGGNAEALEHCRPVLNTYASHIFYAGASGCGAALKISNNIMALGNQVLAMEAVEFARAHGIEESILMDAASVSTGNSWVVQNWGFFDHVLCEHTLADTPKIFDFLVKELHDAIVSAYEVDGEPVHLPGTAVLAETGPAAYGRRRSIIGVRSK